MLKIRLKRNKEKSVQRFHPWIFSGAIDAMQKLQNGDHVEVESHSGDFLAVGHYQNGSIAVRILSFEKRNIDQELYNERIAQAYALRQSIGLVNNLKTNAFRLVHGEGDSLPGLVVDMYNGTAVVQFHSTGMLRDKDMIVNALRTVLGDSLQCIYDKSSTTLPDTKSSDYRNGALFGTLGANEALENGLRVCPDIEQGQKTGFFIDQRENRQRIEQYSRGRRVLNMCCYSGGFSLYALRGGAQLVHSVDCSARAIEMTRRNVELNFPGDARHDAFVADAFDYMQQTDQRYDLIILDPPAFAKHLNAVRNGMIGYRRLNARAMSIIEPGGLLFTFSCSQAVTKEMFRTEIFTAATLAHRQVRILEQLTQPADHPVNIYHPEGEYLKGLLLYVI